MLRFVKFFFAGMNAYRMLGQFVAFLGYVFLLVFVVKGEKIGIVVFLVGGLLFLSRFGGSLTVCRFFP